MIKNIGQKMSGINKHRTITFTLLVSVLSWSLSSVAQIGRTTKLNGVLPVNGEVISSISSDDGLHIVYKANQERIDQEDLYSVSLKNNQVVRLSDTSPGESILDYAISDDNILVYVLSDGTRGDLFVNTLDGRNLLKINPQASDSERVFAFKINPSGSKIVYATKVINGLESGLDRLYSVDIQGGNNSLLDNAIAFDTIADNSLTLKRLPLEFVNGGSDVVYTVGERGFGPFESPFNAFNLNLFRVPVDGTSSATKLNKLSVTNNAVYNFKVSNNGQNVVFTTDVSQPRRLYSSGLDGRNEVALDARILTNNIFEISSDSTSVIYSAVFEPSNLKGLFSAPINGGGTSTLYTAATANEQIKEFQLGGQKTDVFFRVTDSFVINGQPRPFGAVYRHRSGVGLSLLTPLRVFPSAFTSIGNSQVIIAYGQSAQDSQLFLVNTETGNSLALSDGQIVGDNFFSDLEGERIFLLKSH